MSEVTMRCAVLASGSTGNAVYVETRHTKVLLDAGVGIRQLQAAFKEMAVSLEELDAILVTHEHTDHVRGLPALLRKTQAPVYTTAGTWSQIAHLWREDELPTVRTIYSGAPFSLGELAFEPFTLSHDAQEPVGFCIYAGDEKLVLATDLGYASAKVKDVTRGANAYILETNHDVDLLRAGSYPWHLKRRILGDKGHLSNAHAAEYLLDVLTEDTEQVYLAHLSQENNRPQLAYGVMEAALSQVHKALRERVHLQVTSPTQSCGLSPVRRYAQV